MAKTGSLAWWGEGVANAVGEFISPGYTARNAARERARYTSDDDDSPYDYRDAHGYDQSDDNDDDD